MRTKKSYVDQITTAINALPLEAFERWWDIAHAAKELIQKRGVEYSDSDLNKAKERKAENKAKQRVDKIEARHNETINAIKRGAICQGTFVKVSGARDGEGYREVQQVNKREINGKDSYELVCRQWSFVRGNIVKRTDRFMNTVLVEVKGKQIYIEPCNQITTHQADKVIEIMKRLL